jgi:pimeloyl-ACP methyl ester carboxylesterase
VLLLHGLGCNGAVWDPLVDLLLKRGFSTIVPDFPGHGRSAWTPPYNLGGQAAAIAAAIPQDRPLHVIGHSMGAAAAMLLASGMFGVTVASVLAIGMKVDWSDTDTGRLGAVRPSRLFPSRREAAQRFLRVTGLVGIIGENHRCVQAGLFEEVGGFRLAADPLAARVVDAPVEPILACGKAGGVPVRLACGSEDALVDIASLRRFDKDAVLFRGFGHNVHVAAEAVFAVFCMQVKA